MYKYHLPTNLLRDSFASILDAEVNGSASSFFSIRKVAVFVLDVDLLVFGAEAHKCFQSHHWS